ncbi:hypothetical protein [Thiolapillus sp.]|uniref:hypothetical protein n=1 Tax=Thiolapillus sp. TaxID=2017437 RepID=UPI003AF46757
MSDVVYAVDAQDTELGTKLKCDIRLTPYVGHKLPPIRAITTTIVLGQFPADQVAQQASDFFMSDHSVQIDKAFLQEFLEAIQKVAVTDQINVNMTIADVEDE